MIGAGFSTARLAVTELPAARHPRLAAEVAALLTPEVLAPLPRGLKFDGDATGWLAARAAESVVGLVRAEGALVGLLILAPDPPVVHLGYLFGEAAWGKGYATELVRGLVRHLQDGEFARIIGGVDDSNLASARVLEKVGFRRDDALSEPGTDLFVRDL